MTTPKHHPEDIKLAKAAVTAGARFKKVQDLVNTRCGGFSSLSESSEEWILTSLTRARTREVALSKLTQEERAALLGTGY